MGSQDEDDERFKHIGKDPKFKRIPYETRKVKIDKRFQSMFKDEKFKVKYNVDKRGFPIKPQTNADDFKKFYNLDSKDDKDKESSSEEEEEEDDDEVSGEESDASVDIARGVGIKNDVESSSDEESSEEEADEEDKFKHEWGELDQDAERTEETSHRLAVMHMDWDRIKAKDLMVLFNSFLPQGGSIASVNIYPSEFGKQRMAEEEVKGPLELVEHSEESEGDEDGEQSTEGSSYHREKLRQYQLNRLKYYYAVVVFDSAESANKVYTECDNMEYESSATRVDLRFIPDDTEFDEEPKESCTELPDLSKYKPRNFMNSALQQVKVNLTWDETDPDRVEAVSKLMSGDVDEHNLKTYLATSSEEEDNAVEEDDNEDEALDNNEDEKPTNTKKESKQDVINKYRALLKSINDDEAGKKNDVEMEISWGVGLEDRTKELMKEKNRKELTPFEKLMEKKKEKRKKKREEKQKSEKENGDDNDIPSDIDMNDPYFKEEIDAMKKTNKKAKQQSGNKQLEEEDGQDLDSSEDEDNNDEANAQANLELLLMDDKQLGGNNGDKHFNMKKIEENEKEKGKKKKKSMKNYRKKKMEEKKESKEKDDDIQDGFKVDVIDSRFNAVYTSHHYNIDPADPHFHRTQAMQAIIEEKQKRRRQADNEPVPEVRLKKKR